MEKTRISPTGEQGGCPERNSGFTLLELLVVMTILATAVVLLSTNIGTGTTDLKTLSTNIASQLRDARAAAVASNRQAIVKIDLARRRIVTDHDGRELQLPEGVTLLLTVADSVRAKQSEGVIRFFPNGSSTGGVLQLTSEQNSYEIRVNWFTGRVQAVLATRQEANWWGSKNGGVWGRRFLVARITDRPDHLVFGVGEFA